MTHTPKVSALKEEELLTCPYSTAHRIRRFKMSVHLLKCRRTNISPFTKQCVYNVNHIVPSLEWEFHLEHCEDRITGDVQRFVIEPDPECSASFVPISNIPLISNDDDDEDWGKHTRPIRSTNEMLQQNLVEKPVVVLQQGLTKSQRKQRCMNERRRLNNLNESDFKPPPVFQSDISQPLRKPKTESKPMAPLSVATTQTHQTLINGIGRGRGVLQIKNGINKVGNQSPVKAETLPPIPQIENVPIKEEKQSPPSVRKTPVPINSLSDRQRDESPAPFRKFEIDEDGFCKIPIPNKGRGRKKMC